jgi:hypothetical protein
MLMFVAMLGASLTTAPPWGERRSYFAREDQKAYAYAVGVAEGVSYDARSSADNKARAELCALVAWERVEPVPSWLAPTGSKLSRECTLSNVDIVDHQQLAGATLALARIELEPARTALADLDRIPARDWQAETSFTEQKGAHTIVYAVGKDGASTPSATVLAANRARARLCGVLALGYSLPKGTFAIDGAACKVSGITIEAVRAGANGSLALASFVLPAGQKPLTAIPLPKAQKELSGKDATQALRALASVTADPATAAKTLPAIVRAGLRDELTLAVGAALAGVAGASDALLAAMAAAKSNHERVNLYALFRRSGVTLSAEQRETVEHALLDAIDGISPSPSEVLERALADDPAELVREATRVAANAKDKETVRVAMGLLGASKGEAARAAIIAAAKSGSALAQPAALSELALLKPPPAESLTIGLAGLAAADEGTRVAATYVVAAFDTPEAMRALVRHLEQHPRESGAALDVLIRKKALPKALAVAYLDDPVRRDFAIDAVMQEPKNPEVTTRLIKWLSAVEYDSDSDLRAAKKLAADADAALVPALQRLALSSPARPPPAFVAPLLEALARLGKKPATLSDLDAKAALLIAPAGTPRDTLEKACDALDGASCLALALQLEASGAPDLLRDPPALAVFARACFAQSGDGCAALLRRVQTNADPLVRRDALWLAKGAGDRRAPLSALGINAYAALVWPELDVWPTRCDGGDARACFELHIAGQAGVKKDARVSPDAWRKKACAIANGGETCIGDLYDSQDPGLRAACEQGRLAACESVLAAQATFQPSKTELVALKKLATVMCDAGDPRGCFHRGWIGERQRDKGARADFQRACDKDEPRACAEVAREARDPAAKKAILERACAAEHAAPLTNGHYGDACALLARVVDAQTAPAIVRRACYAKRDGACGR